jgi:hypothetical protein
MRRADVARELIEEHSLLRANPSKYAAKLEAIIPQFEGLFIVKSPTLRIKTKEGATAVLEALKENSSDRAYSVE